MINEIFVKSRKDMVAASATISKPSIILSIHDVGSKPAIFHYNPNIVRILQFEFEDWDKENDGEIVITDFDANRMAAVVLTYEDMPDEYDLYVNCEAGMSRSAGVGAAICKALGGSDDFFFRTKHPNMLCYRKVYDAMLREIEERKKV